MADRYDGTVELLDADGNVIDSVRVYLQKDRGQGGLTSWAGHIEPATFDGGDWMETKRIRLNDGSEADAFVTKTNVKATDGGSVREGQLQGSGPAPF